jgi:hypothetical protein
MMRNNDRDWLDRFADGCDDANSWLVRKDWPGLIWVAIFAAVSFGLAYIAVTHDERIRATAPCSEFSSEKLSDVPARCVDELTRGKR